MSFYKSYLANRKLQDNDVIRSEFINMLINVGIPFKSEAGGIVSANTTFAGNNFIDTIVGFLTDVKKFNSAKIASVLIGAKLTFEFDGTNFVEQAEPQKRTSPQNNPPKRLRFHTVELCAFKYEEDQETKKLIGSIMNDFSEEYIFRVNSTNTLIGKSNQVIQILFSDHPTYPVIPGAVRIGILDNDETVPKFMEDAGCYIYLKYDYTNTVFVNSENELKGFGRLLTLSSDMSKNMFPEQVIARRKSK